MLDIGRVDEAAEELGVVDEADELDLSIGWRTFTVRLVKLRVFPVRLEPVRCPPLEVQPLEFI